MAALADLPALIWSRLAGAEVPARGPFGLLYAAGIDALGAPTVRTIVLREVIAAEQRIRFYSDRRSPKVADIGQDPRLALVGYDTEKRTQLRMTGHATLVEDTARRRAWEALAEHQLIDYRSTVPPGTVLTHAPTAAAASRAPAGPPPARDDGYAHFCVIDVQLDQLDWLDLSEKARPVRARFERHADGWRGAWIAP